MDDRFLPNVDFDIDRCPEFQLRAWVAIIVLGWEFRKLDKRLDETTWLHCWAVPGETGVRYDIPNFTSDMEAAHTLMLQMATDWTRGDRDSLWYWALVPRSGSVWEARIMRGQFSLAHGYADWLATAIAKAAVRYCLKREVPITAAQFKSLKTYHEYGVAAGLT